MSEVAWSPMPRFLLRKFMVMSMLRDVPKEDRSCLEIGHGSGDILCTLASQGYIAHGFDFSPMARATARAMVKERGLAERVTIHDSLEAVGDRRFDLVAAFEVLEHIPDDQAAIRNWAARLKAGGTLILSVPAHMSKWGASDVEVGHVRRYERQAFLDLLEANSIEVRDIRVYGYPLTIVLDPLANIFADAGTGGEAPSEKDDPEERSKRSFRKNIGLARIVSNPLIVWPFHMMQLALSRTDLGSGYVVRGVKK